MIQEEMTKFKQKLKSLTEIQDIEKYFYDFAKVLMNDYQLEINNENL